MVHIFHFLQTGLVFENLNPFSWIFNAISSVKSCLISKRFLTCLLDVRTLDFFPAFWILIGQFKFPARQPYARKLKVCHIRGKGETGKAFDRSQLLSLILFLLSASTLLAAWLFFFVYSRCMPGFAVESKTSRRRGSTWKPYLGWVPLWF